ADAKCTLPLFAFDPTGGGCDTNAQKPKWLVPISLTIGGCGSTDRLNPLRPVLDLHRGVTYRIGNSGACVVAEQPGVPAAYQIYDLGDPVDPASVFTEVTEQNY